MRPAGRGGRLRLTSLEVLVCLRKRWTPPGWDRRETAAAYAASRRSRSRSPDATHAGDPGPPTPNELAIRRICERTGLSVSAAKYALKLLELSGQARPLGNNADRRWELARREDPPGINGSVRGARMR